MLRGWWTVPVFCLHPCARLVCRRHLSDIRPYFVSIIIFALFFFEKSQPATTIGAFKFLIKAFDGRFWEAAEAFFYDASVKSLLYFSLMHFCVNDGNIIPPCLASPFHVVTTRAKAKRRNFFYFASLQLPPPNILDFSGLIHFSESFYFAPWIWWCERESSSQWVDGLKSKSSNWIPTSFPLGGWFMKKLFSLEWKAPRKAIFFARCFSPNFKSPPHIIPPIVSASRPRACITSATCWLSHKIHFRGRAGSA